MIGVILCGGLGTRLRQVLPGLPKAMAPVGGRPFLEYLLEQFKRADIGEIVLCVGYKWEVIHNYFGNGQRFGVRLHYSIEEQPMGTGGGLALARPLLRDTFLVLNGDTYINIDPNLLLAYHRDKEALITVVLARVEDSKDYGSATLASDGRLLGFAEKIPGMGWVNAGAYLMEPSVLSWFPKNAPCSLEREILPMLTGKNMPIYGYCHDGVFIDIGTPERYSSVKEGLPGLW